MVTAFIIVSALLVILFILNRNKNRYIETLDKELSDLKTNKSSLEIELNKTKRDLSKANEEIDNLNNLNNKRNINLEKFLSMKMKSMPYLAGMIADYITYDIEVLAKKLDWGHNQERAKKVASIREIRKNASERIAEAKVAVYQLEYLKQLYPSLEEILDTDYEELSFRENLEDYKEYDPVKDYLSKDEYSKLSESERNQRALDNYIASHRKTKWQIGRDYELYVGYLYEKSGYIVNYYGSNNKIDDLGRDLIVDKGNSILIIQCKYWSQEKQIHEKHINQLFGTTISYAIEHNLPSDKVIGILVTNTNLSNRAKQFADRLNIKYRENLPLGDYPRIKCNINRDEFGITTKIYHLPMDQQYDNVIIDKPGEFFAFTVAEAEAAGFRRAYRWRDK